MKWAGTLAGALLAEAAAHFLSLSWGFMVLLFLFVVTGLRAQAATAKAADTEKRVNALVPAVGAVKDQAATAQSTANTAQSTANSAQTDADNAQYTANNALPKGGGTMSGQLNGTTMYMSGGATTNGFTSHGDVNADNNLNAGNAYVDGTVQGNQVHAAGVSSSASVAGTTFHFTGNCGVDGSLSVGSLSLGSLDTGPIYCDSISIAAMDAVAHPTLDLASIKQAVDGILNRL